MLWPIPVRWLVLRSGNKYFNVEKAVPSWSLVVRTRSPCGNLAGVVPSVLASYDLPDLAAALGPRKMTIREPVDPAAPRRCFP